MRELLKEDWQHTPKGDKRGYIDSQELRELWFHTGTNCNLSCPFCLEGSKPGDDRLNFLTSEDVLPFLDEAVGLGCRKISFTGGEPFVNPHFVDMLSAALERLPCMVLTNGTEPLRNRFADVVALKDKPNDLSFRISLDHPDPELHDVSRGKGNFRMALRTLGQLHEAGFQVSIARLQLADEDSAERDASYRPFFREAGLPDTMTIVRFPDFMTPGSVATVPFITESCMVQYTNDMQRGDYMCAFSRMVVKAGGRIGVYACTLVDDDPDYNLAATLRESLQVRIRLKHHRCYSCFAYGSSCSEGA